jgi:DGQHR domain-containing protein
MSNEGLAPVITKVATFDEARNRAMERVMSGNAIVLPCMTYRQGGRSMISFVLPLAVMKRHLEFDSTPKGGDVRAHLNRTLMPDHVSSIKGYLRDNHDRYILPGITLNAAAHVEIFQIGEPLGGIAAGFVVLGSATRFVPVDGQHRGAAIVGYKRGDRFTPGILDDLPELGDDGVTVQLTLEDDIVQLHQDFADAGRTKPIPANTLAAYDMRQPVNQLLNTVIEQSPFLKGRIDTTSKTLSARAQAVFLVSSIRGLVKVMMLGSTRPSEQQFEKEVFDRFKTQGAREETVAAVGRLLSTLTENMEPWNVIAGLKPGFGESNSVPELRERYVNLTMSGLVVIGTVGHYAWTHTTPDQQVEIYKRLAAVNWSRVNPMWQETGFIKKVGKDGTYKYDVTRSRTEIDAAAERLMAFCAIQ